VGQTSPHEAHTTTQNPNRTGVPGSGANLKQKQKIKKKGGKQMASIINASAALRIRSGENRAVCSVSGVNPNMTASDAAGFATGIQTMYNRGPVKARIHIVSDVVMNDTQE
jgi:hypothetical protein